MVAASSGNDRLVRMLLDEPLVIGINLKFDINIELKKDKCPNNIYQSHDSCGQAKYHWKFPNNINFDCGNEIGRSALWIACFNGHLNVVRTLIEFGKADVNLPDHKNWSPLRAAIFNKHIDIIKYLIEQVNAIIDESRDLSIAI
jgi:ankyrin repeat protein